MTKSFSGGMIVCLLFASVEVVSAPIVKIIGVGISGAAGQLDLAKRNYDMTGLDVISKNLSGAECINIAGGWYVSESITYTCVLAGEDSFTDSDSGSGTVDMLQNGCNVSYVPPTINAPRSGQISGNQINLSGAFVVPLDPGVALSQNNATLTGTVNEEQFTINGTGLAVGTAYGIPFSCSGNSIAKFTKNPATLNNIECLLNWAENAYSNLFSPAGAISQFQSPYTYRYYWNTNSYVGVSSIDNHVYYLGPDGILQDVGPLSNWLPMAGCQ